MQQRHEGGAFRLAGDVDEADPAFDLLEVLHAFDHLLECRRFERTKTSADMEEFLLDFASLLERQIERLL